MSAKVNESIWELVLAGWVFSQGIVCNTGTIYLKEQGEWNKQSYDTNTSYISSDPQKYLEAYFPPISFVKASEFLLAMLSDFMSRIRRNLFSAFASLSFLTQMHVSMTTWPVKCPNAPLQQLLRHVKLQQTTRRN